MNIPLAQDTTALRIVGTYRDDDGFIDNIARGEDDANSSSAYSVRALLSSSLGERVDVELLAMLSEIEEDDFPNIDSGLGDLELDSSEPRFHDGEFRLYGLTVDVDLGFAELTSVTSQTDIDREFLDRLLIASPLLFRVRAGHRPTPSTPARNRNRSPRSCASSRRATSSLTGFFGAFYRDKDQVAVGGATTMPGEHHVLNQTLGLIGFPLIPDSTFVDGTGDLAFRFVTDRYEQYAVYAEGDLEFGDRWNLTLGARWFDEEVTLEDELVFYSFLAFASSPYRVVEESSSDVLLKGRLSYRAQDDLLFYFTVAEGFRSGGINLQSVFGVGDLLFESDALISYELGTKTSWYDGRVLLNGAVYFQDWADIQSNGTDISPLTGAPVNFIGNAGDAEVVGVEAQLKCASERCADRRGYAGLREQRTQKRDRRRGGRGRPAQRTGIHNVREPGIRIPLRRPGRRFRQPERSVHRRPVHAPAAHNRPDGFSRRFLHRRPVPPGRQKRERLGRGPVRRQHLGRACPDGPRPHGNRFLQQPRPVCRQPAANGRHRPES